jgi:hypothetical protein
LRAVVEAAGLALHNEEPERISRLFDETIADFSIGRVRPRACGKCRQRSLSRRPSRPSADAFSWAISYSRVAYPERSKFNAIGALRNMACRLCLIYWSSGGCSRQNAAVREVMRNGSCASRACGTACAPTGKRRAGRPACCGAGNGIARRAVGAGDPACLADGAARPARADALAHR